MKTFEVLLNTFYVMLLSGFKGDCGVECGVLNKKWPPYTQRLK